MSTPDPAGAHLSLLRLLTEVTRSFERELNRELRAHLDDELRPAHYAVFRYLDPAGSRISALAEAAGMTQQSMGELVTQLQRCGLVERRVDPADRRARLVVVTDTGAAALRLAAQRVERIERHLRSYLGADGIADLRRLLRQAGEALSGSGH
ncbi:MarR family winged helix-turn-helix transcriptional regulator [Nocardia donostiensis]|uniref:MarR family transcriptional regulator n=1 Tax=Nocardia donostiensis TaxID=1538463 RepID=A0A1W0ASJ5_9NOCA|nr:MarR family winged helix-turn-helix transcriptional regulator [Nocardia donostiensis]ONM46848.1 MarR family transcriptional regulator [Nocardia donostiensis]OQS13197.1 MarR family transcriptional regulator [Nocardia donostiensis]OQS19106.1 MarR family transcriptional regulator [Nocardia donostiensis]